MKPDEARMFRAAHDSYVKILDPMTVSRLSLEYKREMAAHSMISVFGGPVGRDELIRELVELRYPIKKLNEAIHASGHMEVTWPDCEYCREQYYDGTDWKPKHDTV